MKSNEEILSDNLYPIFADNEDYHSFKEESPDLIAAILSAMEEARNESKWNMPTDKQLIEIAILFNEGKVEYEKLSEMVGMCQFVLDRLYENGTITKPTKAENAESPLP